MLSLIIICLALSAAVASMLGFILSDLTRPRRLPLPQRSYVFDVPLYALHYVSRTDGKPYVLNAGTTYRRAMRNRSLVSQRGHCAWIELAS